MRHFGGALALCLAVSFGLSGPALAFEPAVAALIGKLKPNKLVPGEVLGVLMAESAIWCYDSDGASCRWTDRYLAADGTGAEFELSYLWTPEIAVTLTSGLAIAGDSACYSGIDYVDTLTATVSGEPVTGKALDKVRRDLRATLEPDAGVEFCFDYSFLAASESEETVTILQREYKDGIYTGADTDVQVTIHFEPGSAEALTLRQ